MWASDNWGSLPCAIDCIVFYKGNCLASFDNKCTFLRPIHQYRDYWDLITIRLYDYEKSLLGNISKQFLNLKWKLLEQIFSCWHLNQRELLHLPTSWSDTWAAVTVSSVRESYSLSSYTKTCSQCSHTRKPRIHGFKVYKFQVTWPLSSQTAMAKAPGSLAPRTDCLGQTRTLAGWPSSPGQRNTLWATSFSISQLVSLEKEEKEI